MAYIYEKIISGKSYYYLRISKKVKNKLVVKDIAYLGTDIEKIQEKIDKIPKKYSPEIRKSYNNIKKYINSNYYLKKVEKIKSDKYIEYDKLKEIESVKLHYNSKFLKLDALTKADYYLSFLVEFAHNTTSIEGNTITLKQASDIIYKNKGINKDIREIFDIKNTKEAFFYLIENNPKLSKKLIIELHKILVKNIDERVGFRNHDIRVFKANFKSTPKEFVETDIKLLLEWYEKNKTKYHPLVLACLFHHKFEKIHPFADGNGRTGRMLMIYILIQNKYPPFIVHVKNRDEYLSALSLADKSELFKSSMKDYKKLIDFVSSEYIKSYWNHFLE